MHLVAKAGRTGRVEESFHDEEPPCMHLSAGLDIFKAQRLGSSVALIMRNGGGQSGGQIVQGQEHMMRRLLR